MLSRLQSCSARRTLQLVELSRATPTHCRTANAFRVYARFNSSSTNNATSKSIPPKSSFFTKAKKTAKWSAILCVSSAAGLFAVGGVIFLHDAFTYSHKHIDRVPVDPLALHPELGGPKNLPVARVLVDDEDNEINKKLNSKPKLVIVGGGWGVCHVIWVLQSVTRINDFVDFQAMGVLKTLNPGDYHVTVISPETFTTFTPLLPCKIIIFHILGHSFIDPRPF